MPRKGPLRRNVFPKPVKPLVYKPTTGHLFALNSQKQVLLLIFLVVVRTQVALEMPFWDPCCIWKKLLRNLLGS